MWHRRPKPLSSWAKFCLITISLAFGLGLSAHAQTGSEQDPNKKLEELQEEIRAGERQREILNQQTLRANRAANELSERLVRAAREIQLAEENVSRLEVRTADLTAEVDDKRARLMENNTNITELIAALERLSNRPAVLTLLKPDAAIKTARSSAIMAALVPEIDAQADTLRTDLAALASVQDELSRERFALKNSLERLTSNQRALSTLLADRKKEAQQATARARQLERELAQYAEEANSLQELVARLEREAANARRRAQAQPSIARSRAPARGDSLAQQKGKIPLPAVGPIVTRFGAKENNASSKGIKIRTRKNAQIIAPFDGSVVFAGPFRDYGLLLIIDHGGGYHSLLAGFDALQSGAGDWVLMGEPIGTMPDTDVSGDLYLELRQNGRAINPLPWLQQQPANAR